MPNLALSPSPNSNILLLGMLGFTFLGVSGTAGVAGAGLAGVAAGGCAGAGVGSTGVAGLGCTGTNLAASIAANVLVFSSPYLAVHLVCSATIDSPSIFLSENTFIP